MFRSSAKNIGALWAWETEIDSSKTLEMRELDGELKKDIGPVALSIKHRDKQGSDTPAGRQMQGAREFSGSEMHWNEQDLQVLWNRNGVSLQMKIKLDTLLINIHRALKASGAPSLSYDSCSELLMPMRHFRKTYSGFPALPVVLVEIQGLYVHSVIWHSEN